MSRSFPPFEKGGPGGIFTVKSPKAVSFAIPAKAGIQYFNGLAKYLDPVFQRGDGFWRVHRTLDIACEAM